MGYKKTALKGISWMFSLNISTGVVSLLKLVILARLLSPEDFGVFGIYLLMISLLETFTETGINVVLIQSKKSLSHYLNSAWILSIGRGILISSILILFSSLIVNFFNSPKSLNVLLLMSLAPFLKGFINPAEIVFQKELKFNYEFLLRIVVFSLDTIVSIILTILTKSVYGLVFGMLVGIIAELLISFIFIKKRPKLKFNKNQLLEIFHKGKWVTFSGIFQYVAQNLDDIVVGKILGAHFLGIYQLAYKIGSLVITEITNVINTVFFPLYSKISENKSKLESVFFKSTFTLSIIVIPISLIIIFFSKEIILIFLGSKWIEAVNILKILAFYGMLRAIIGYPSSLFLALGKQNYVSYMTFTRAIFLGLTIVPLTYFYGITGAAFSAVFSVIVEAPIVIYLLFKIFKK